MDAPNKYVTILLTAAVLYGGYTLLFSPPKKKQQPVSAPISESTLPAKQETQVQPVIDKVGHGEAVVAERLDRRRSLNWSRDPFLCPRGMEPNRPKIDLKDIKLDEPALLNCKVTSILISGRQKAATVDRSPYVVMIGDYIDNERVLDIAKNRIVLGLGGRKHEIIMENTVAEVISFKGMK